MHKRFISSFLVIALVLSIFSLSAFAEEHQHTFENKREFDLSNLPDGYSIPFTIYEAPCSGGCGYSEFSWDVFGVSGKFVDKTGTSGIEVYKHWREWFESVYGKNANPEKLDPTNAGDNIPASGGRNPKGYGDEGKANISPNGVELIWVEPFGLAVYSSAGFSRSAPSTLFAGSSPSETVFSGSKNVLCCAVYEFTAPVSGLYYVGSSFNPYDFGTVEFFSSSSGKWIALDGLASFSSAYCYSKTLNKGDSCYFYFSFGQPLPNAPFRANLLNLHIAVDPLGDSSITTTNNITINNNTWNGNIYTDNSTNLTYIYPEYTTINEKNETVTNISTNPIIYNNETKQYYTYDSTTNNYYYITYNETPTPSPSPEPSPTPDPSKPDVTPTPTPAPGEDTGDTPTIIQLLESIRLTLVNGFKGITEKLTNIGVGGSTPETAKPGSSGDKGQNWWEKLLGKIGDAIVDGLLGAISAVLKLIFKLFSTVLGWIIWVVSRVFDLLPFLPPGLGGLLVGGVVVCFVIGIIKFIRG